MSLRLRGRLVPRFILLSKPYFLSEQRLVAWGLLALLVGLMLTNTAAGVLLVRQTGEFTTALAERDSARYWKSIYYSIGLIAIAIPIYGLYYYVRDRLTVHWREWMTKFFMDKYFANRAFYKLSYLPNIDNPDQRIAEDINSFTSRSIYFLLIFIETVLQIIAYSGLLWLISQKLVVFLLIYAVVGTLVTWLVFGRPLVGLNFFQLRREADFRFGLVRVRENAESIAFYHGEPREQSYLGSRLDDVVSNYKRLLVWQFFLNVFQYAFTTAIVVIPGIILAPRVMSGELEPGTVTEAVGAFSAVFGALNVIVNKFDLLSLFTAGVGRLDRFYKVLDKATIEDDEDSTTSSKQVIETVEEPRVAFENLTLHTPDAKRTLIQDLSLTLEKKEGLLIVGASGGGKSSLLRAFAGLWRSGEGTVVRPSLDEMLFLPQRPYLIIGTLRDQLLYPASGGNIPDERLQEVLEFVNLPQLVERCGGLDVSADWGKTLSLGEQQRLAIARVLLAERPYVILDEATSALDEENEARVYETLQQSEVTLISISHRPQVARYHTKVLVLNGEQGWELLTSEEYLATLQDEPTAA
ncbi:MAG TPA: ABC transporter ATP-binding protein/permease [Planctomycetaceae bacterium]|nr:ABC transporter ATP-binding protein/permease [Planctomycetaceae bacterium]